jgi:uracil-DNA glycosylase family 4
VGAGRRPLGAQDGGFDGDPPNSGWVSGPDDQIYEKYQAKAIAEINRLGHDIAEWVAQEHPAHAPVLGTGHPLADIFLLKYRPAPAEVEEGVAFFGRAGQAILRSIQRLRIDPLLLYGTDCLKVDIQPAAADLERSREWLVRELHITQPRIVVVTGQEALDFLNALEFPLARPAEPEIGRIQRFTPTIEVLLVPDIDSSLNEAPAKQAFWSAFRVLGEWYENLPPY